VLPTTHPLCPTWSEPVRSNLTQEGWCRMSLPLTHLWSNDEGQDIAEYAVMLAVIWSWLSERFV